MAPKSDDDDFDGEVAILRGGAAKSFLDTLRGSDDDDGDDDDDDLSDEEASILDKLLARKSKGSSGAKHAKGGDKKPGFRYFGDR